MTESSPKRWLVKFFSQPGDEGSQGWYACGPPNFEIGMFRTESFRDQKVEEWNRLPRNYDHYWTQVSEIEWEEDKEFKKQQELNKKAAVKRRLEQFLDGLDEKEKEIASQFISLK